MNRAFWRKISQGRVNHLILETSNYGSCGTTACGRSEVYIEDSGPNSTKFCPKCEKFYYAMTDRFQKPENGNPDQHLLG